MFWFSGWKVNMSKPLSVSNMVNQEAGAGCKKNKKMCWMEKTIFRDICTNCKSCLEEEEKRRDTERVLEDRIIDNASDCLKIFTKISNMQQENDKLFKGMEVEKL